MYLALLLAFTLASLAPLFVVGIIALSSLERPYKLFTALTRGVPEGVLIGLQITVIFEVAFVANVKEQPGADIGCRMVHTAELISSESVRFEVGNKATDERNEFPYIAVFFGSNEFFQNLFI